MNVTIKLTKAQIKGIREYLKAVSHDVEPRISLDDIREEIRGMVNAEMQAGSVGDFIRKEEEKE